MREEALAEIQPDPLDRVELRRVGRQEQRRQVGWDRQILDDVLPGAIHQHDRMSGRATAWPSSSSIACMAAALTVGSTSAPPASRSGQTAAEQIARLVAQVAHAARA